MVREEKRKTLGRMDTILLHPFRFFYIRDAGRVPISIRDAGRVPISIRDAGHVPSTYIT